MSTVISLLPTAEGVVIGSDGRESGPNLGEIITDDAQKIFAIDKPGIRLAYALFGSIKIGLANDNVLFDFEQEIAPAVERIGVKKNWWEYLATLVATLSKDLNEARETSKTTMDSASTERGTYISIGGYYGKFQKLGHIEFRHGIHDTGAEPHSYPPGFSFPFGSVKIFDLINSGDPRFAQYSQPPRKGLTTLSAGIDRVRQDVLAHYDPQALGVDEVTCRGIGGRVQIATVTIADGFRWVPGFEAISAKPGGFLGRA